VNGERRRLLGAFGSACFAKASQADPARLAPRRIAFPRDYGAHLAYRTEWWYLTGQLDPPAGSREPRLGVQLTFFRIHPPIDPDNPSRFAAHQLVLAHAAIADPRRGALLHEERIARAGFGIASVSDVDTEVEVDHWRLAREAATGVYRGRARGAQFALELTAAPTQPPLLQGEDGYSRKGPAGAGGVPASLYYSEPQLALQARIRIDDSGTDQRRLGRGWLDHEWSSTLLPPQASGWDWAGFNLDDGSALTVFRIRRAGASSGEAAWFAYASLRAHGARVQIFPPAQVRFEPLQTWISPRTRAAYPVAQRIAIGSRQFETRPLMPDQELDARAASGIVYWEGASDLLEDGRTVGRGYLELTGYAGPVPGDLSG
jgi:predicted secreted hydrolase